MTTDVDIRATEPDRVPQLDHDVLQRRGRRRRTMVRSASGVAGAAAVAALVAIGATVLPPQAGPSVAGNSSTGAEDPASKTPQSAETRDQQDGLAAVEAANAEADAAGRDRPDPEWAASLGPMSASQVIDHLDERARQATAPTVTTRLQALSTRMARGEALDEWSHVDRVDLTAPRGGDVVLRADLREDMTTAELRAVLPMLASDQTRAGDETDAYSVYDPNVDGEFAEQPRPIAAQALAILEGQQGTPLPEADAPAVSRDVAATLRTMGATARVTTDVLDRTVVALRVTLAGDSGAVETMDVHFDPETGLVTGTETELDFGWDNGTPVRRHQATVVM